jgi:hypothetical protein
MPGDASAKQKERARKEGLGSISSYSKKDVTSKKKGSLCMLYRTNGKVVKVLYGKSEGRGLPFGKILKFAKNTNRAMESAKQPADRNCLAKFHGVALADKKWGLEYEWVEGTPLDKWDYSKHTPRELGRVINCVAKALLHLNDKKLAHTGLRAHDIIVKENGNAVLVDYHHEGKSKPWGKQVSRRLLGTVLYEVLTGESMNLKDGRQVDANAYRGAMPKHSEQLKSSKSKSVTPFKSLLKNLLKDGNTGLKTAINMSDRIANRVSKARK